MYVKPVLIHIFYSHTYYDMYRMYNVYDAANRIIIFCSTLFAFYKYNF